MAGFERSNTTCTDDEAKPVIILKKTFEESLNTLLLKKSSNSELLSREKYLKLIEEVKEAKTKVKKQSVDYRRLRKYDIIESGREEKLIVPLTNFKPVYYVSTEELFDLLHDTHLKTGHAGRTRMEKELQKGYKNVTKEVITMYLRLCLPCQAKLSNRRKVSASLLFEEFNSRCQVDVIDMQTNPDGGYKFILHYQDHLTKFVILRPLKCKTTEQVAEEVLDIFTILGAPSVLQSDNGKEFAREVVNELKTKWPELKIVYGKPRQGQGSIDQDVQKIIMSYLKKPVQWADKLRFVQFTKNRSFHEAIQQSPHEAMFGRQAKVGLSTSNLSKEVIDNLIIDEDLEKKIKTEDVSSHEITMKIEPMEYEESSEEINGKFFAVCQGECFSPCQFCGKHTLHRKKLEENHRERLSCSNCNNKQTSKSRTHADEEAQSAKKLKISLRIPHVDQT